jgi:transcriptional regulator GlxA family with amidase domain
MQRLVLVAVLILAPAAFAESARPLVAIVAQNGGTETTDFLVPFAVLSQSGVADVVPVALEPGPVALHPALTIELGETIDSFDRAHPDGADFVIVPAVMYPDDARLLAWLRSQAARRAVAMSICDGALVLARTGLLDDHAATAFWMSLGNLEKDYPKVRWVRNRRWVDDGRVVSTTGVTASIPGSLALVERIAGPERARAVAAEVGVAAWSAAHDTSAFAISADTVATGAGNWLAFWRHERVGLRIADGVDELALGLTADALARTWIARPVALADAPVTTRRGLRVVAAGGAVDRVEPLGADGAPALDAALASIAARYGADTADFVALQLEYPRR